MTVTALVESASVADGATYNGPATVLEAAPFEDTATWQFQCSGAPQSVTLQGRAAPDANWADLNTVTTTQAAAVTVRFAPEYRVVVQNAVGGGAITVISYIGR